MKILLLCIGSIKEPYLRDAIKEYEKRLRPYAQLQILELAEAKLPNSASARQIEMAIEEEGARILSKLPPRAQVVSLCIEGKQMDSEHFADALAQWAEQGDAQIAFIIGGSDGLAEAVKKQGARLSFSKLTFPHQLMRVILLEQIYRGFRILHHEPYHK